jgi:hypothetical protein
MSSRPRSENFAERLPPVVPKVEENIDELPDDLVDILYPGRRPRPFQISLVFDAESERDGGATDGAVGRAVAMGPRAAAFRTFQEGSRTRHRADFTVCEAAALRDMAELVAARPGSEVLVAGKKAPYAHELWLPLMSYFIPPSERSG